MDPESDSAKPLGAIDEAGWALAGSLLIGSPRPEFAGAYDLKTKKFAWWYKADADLTAPVAILGSWGVLSLRDGRLVKLETQTGKLVWEARLSRFVASRVTLAGSTLLAFTVDQKLFAIDFQSGQTQWVFDAGSLGNISIRTSVSPVTVGGEVFIANSEGVVYSVSLAGGKENWRMDLGSDVSRFHDFVGEIGIGNRQIYLTRYDGQALALDVSQKPKEPIWKENFSTLTTSAFRDGTLYLGFLNGELKALQATSGRQLWSVNLGQSIKSLTLGEKSVFVGGSQGRVAAVRISDAAVLWYDDLAGILTHQPVVVDDQIYFSTGLRVLYSYKIF